VIQYKQTNKLLLSFHSEYLKVGKENINSLATQLQLLLTCYLFRRSFSRQMPCPALPLHYFSPPRPSLVTQRQIWRSKQLGPSALHSNNSTYLQSTHAATNSRGKTLAARRFHDSHLQLPYIHTVPPPHVFVTLKKRGEKRDGLLCYCVSRQPWTSSPQFHALAVLGDVAARKPHSLHSPHIRDPTHWLPTFSFLTRRFLLRPLARLP
jgi:hypothetical protein